MPLVHVYYIRGLMIMIIIVSIIGKTCLKGYIRPARKHYTKKK